MFWDHFNTKQDNYLCLNCNAKAKSVYKHTEGKFIKLIECKYCHDVVDHFVECERSIIITDLIMQESSAFKHILHNSSDFRPHFYLKLFLAIILSEGYVRWSLYHNTLTQGAATIRNNENIYFTICLTVIIELLAFGAVLLLLFPKKDSRTPILVSKALILGQSGRLINIPAIVYKQSGSPLFQTFVFLFLFVSSIQSVRAITFKSRLTTAFDVSVALVISIIASRLFQGCCL